MVKVTQKISDYVWVGDDYKKGESRQDLEFRDWDDFQNWLGYTAYAREGKTVSIDFKIVPEEKDKKEEE